MSKTHKSTFFAIYSHLNSMNRSADAGTSGNGGPSGDYQTILPNYVPEMEEIEEISNDDIISRLDSATFDKQVNYCPPKKKICSRGEISRNSKESKVKISNDAELKRDLIKNDINEKSKLKYLYITEMYPSSDEEIDTFQSQTAKEAQVNHRRPFYKKQNRVVPTEMMSLWQEIQRFKKFVADSEKVFGKNECDLPELNKEYVNKGVQCELIDGNRPESVRNSHTWSCFKFFKRK